LHVGGARTALFNWLFARRHGGTFVLRIEDTDPERSSLEMVHGILEGLTWLGLDWDEGPNVDGPRAPYFQSQRFDIHRGLAEHLVASRHAYYCYCTPDELKAKREAAEALGGGWKYDRTCATLDVDEIATREAAGRPRAVRVRVPDGIVRFDDLVHGAIEFDGADIEDFIVLRSDGHPTYHLSVVSDDVEMGITHVVRGDDHISNTPKQVLLYRAIGATLPRFAHVPLILGPDKKRLSKRHGATSVMEYARQGYLPEAMVNFLALLGWSPGSGDRELFTKAELVEAFTIDGISRGNAVFNPTKLDWFNEQHVLRLTAEDLITRLRPLFAAAGVWDNGFETTKRPWLLAVLDLLRPRAKKLDDFVTQGAFFFEHADDEGAGGSSTVAPNGRAALAYDELAVAKHLAVPGMNGHLTALVSAFDQLAMFDASSIEASLRAVAEARQMKAASLIHAVRVALTGRSASPGLFEVAALVGRDRSRARLIRAAEMAQHAG
jgi:glutamyl-tRNA synthetase